MAESYPNQAFAEGVTATWNANAQAVRTRKATGWITYYGIPPRCRKARHIREDMEAEVTYREVSSAEAPVAFRWMDPGGVQEVRLFNGLLWEPYSYSRDKHTDAETFLKYPLQLHCVETSSEEGFRRHAQDTADRYLVVDGLMWVQCEEPRYVVQVFGFGSNHGGTGLFVATYDNTNVRADRYFRADEFEQARALAIEVATNRGDTESVERLQAEPPGIEVLVPEAVRLVTPRRESQEVQDARGALEQAVRAYKDDWMTDRQTEGDLWAALVVARTYLSGLTDDISGETACRRPYEER